MFRSHLNLELTSEILVICHQQQCLCCVFKGYLLYRDTSNHTMSAIKINPETLEHEGTVSMPGENYFICLVSEME